LVSFGHCVVCSSSLNKKIPKRKSETVKGRRTDNTMAKGYQRGNQKLLREEEQTTQWPKDTKG
jgi:hypothetical protein